MNGGIVAWDSIKKYFLGSVTTFLARMTPVTRKNRLEMLTIYFCASLIFIYFPIHKIEGRGTYHTKPIKKIIFESKALE